MVFQKLELETGRSGSRVGYWQINDELKLLASSATLELEFDKPLVPILELNLDTPPGDS